MKPKQKTEIKQYPIASVVDVEKSEKGVFVLGTHNEKYWFYVDIKTDGALSLGDYPIEICKLRKTLYENEKPYVRVEEKDGWAISVEFFLPINAVIEEYTPIADTEDSGLVFGFVVLALFVVIVTQIAKLWS